MMSFPNISGINCVNSSAQWCILSFSSGKSCLFWSQPRRNTLNSCYIGIRCLESRQVVNDPTCVINSLYILQCGWTLSVPFIFSSHFLLRSGSLFLSWSQSQLSLGEGWVTPWLSLQFIGGPTLQDKQPSKTLSHTQWQQQRVTTALS